jgi:colicin import membrane protein
MSTLRESSLLFSLESLLETERERVQREAREAQRRRDDELRRAAEAGERRRVAVQREREARERRLLLDREREKFEEQRAEALKQAAIERARIEAESAARLIEAERARYHGLELSRIAADAKNARYRVVSWLSAAALLLVVAGCAVAYWGVLAPAEADQRTHARALAATTEERARVAARALAAERSTAAALAAELARLKAASAASPVAPLAQATPPSPHRPAPAADSRIGSHAGPCKDDGDPLNGCVH